nr:translation initiation factor IF-2-like [Desmodus rotundus]
MVVSTKWASVPGSPGTLLRLVRTRHPLAELPAQRPPRLARAGYEEAEKAESGRDPGRRPRRDAGTLTWAARAGRTGRTCPASGGGGALPRLPRAAARPPPAQREAAGGPTGVALAGAGVVPEQARPPAPGGARPVPRGRRAGGGPPGRRATGAAPRPPAAGPLWRGGGARAPEPGGRIGAQPWLRQEVRGRGRRRARPMAAAGRRRGDTAWTRQERSRPRGTEKCPAAERWEGNVVMASSVSHLIAVFAAKSPAFTLGGNPPGLGLWLGSARAGSR